MSERFWGSDEDLLAGLGEALQSAGHTAASHIAGRAAWTLRDSSQIEMAVLTFDSLLVEAGSLREQNAEARMLTFVTDDDVSLEVELGDDRLVGQVFPAALGTVTIVAVSRSADRAETDDVGCFSLPLPAGPFRLRFESPEMEFLTDWIRL